MVIRKKSVLDLVNKENNVKNYLKHRRKRVYTAIGCVFMLAVCFSGIRLLRFTSETAEAQTLKTAVAVALITS